MSKRKRKMRIGLGPVLFFVAFCVAATIFGIWVNGNIYLKARNPDVQQTNEPT